MKKRIQDNSPRFERHKSYAIGVLQGNSVPTDVPERFATSPVKPLYLSGTDLLGNGMKSCRDFLTSKNCHFRIGSAVHFYEVEYKDNDAPVYKNIFIGSPLAQKEQGLSDAVSKDGLPVINNIIPNTQASEYEKMFFKTQSEAIAYYQKCLLDERRQFADERNILTLKIEEKNDEILSLNLKINELKAENESLKIKYDEANKFADRISQMSQKQTEQEAEGLADKGIAMLDGMLGEGASQQIVAGFATGIGNGVGKLIDLGVDFIRAKGMINTAPEPTVTPELQAQTENNKN